jgi:hypothetical protein
MANLKTIILQLLFLLCAMYFVVGGPSKGTPVAAPAAAAPHAADKEDACSAAAFTDYNQANLVLLDKPGLPMPVDTVIGKRRLQELFCLRVGKCHLASSPPQSEIGSEVEFNSDFSTCLDSEAVFDRKAWQGNLKGDY